MTKSRRTYAGMVSALDAAVGRLEQIYTNAGIWNQTVLIFTTDNSGPLRIANNFPLRGHKATAWEGGVRGVAFVRGTDDPSMFPVAAGTMTTQLMHYSDWLPTLASVAGFALNGTQALDGVDQSGVLARGENTTRQFVVHNCPGPALQPLSKRAGAMHVGHRWKLMFEGEPSMQVSANTVQTPSPGFTPPARGNGDTASASLVCPPPGRLVRGHMALRRRGRPARVPQPRRQPPRGAESGAGGAR